MGSSDDAEQPSGEDKTGSGLPVAAGNKPKKQYVADACGYILQVMGAKAENKADKKEAKETQKATATATSNSHQEDKEDKEQEMGEGQPVMTRPNTRSMTDGDEDGEPVPKLVKQARDGSKLRHRVEQGPSPLQIMFEGPWPDPGLQIPACVNPTPKIC